MSYQIVFAAFREALKSSERVLALRAVAIKLKSAGSSQREIYDVFSAFCKELPEGSDAEDAVLDTMDLLVGCGPEAARVFAEPLTDS